jgi:hypothetical protein
MIIGAAMLFGALLGWGAARRQGGNRLDQAQYAAGFGIAMGLLGVIVTVILGRML